jgi:hypothetical protein
MGVALWGCTKSYKGRIAEMLLSKSSGYVVQPQWVLCEYSSPRGS